MRSSFLSCVCVLALGCSGAPDITDAGRDASVPDAFVPTDAFVPDAFVPDAFVPDAFVPDAFVPDAFVVRDAGPSCLDEGHVAGERYPVGDLCNFCECLASGVTTCTDRACPEQIQRCEYGGVTHDIGVRFPAADGCNECICAYSGLACTRRTSCDPVFDDGAILLESLDEPCGTATPAPFTARSVIEQIPVRSFELPFLYGRDRDPREFPETLPDTTIRFRFVYDDGPAVCLLGSPAFPIIDMEVTAEWVTADGSFDEGFHTIVRRYGNTMFVDAWNVDATAPPGALNGTYRYSCLDPRDFGFVTTINRDGSIDGHISKTCETDINVFVGTFSRAAD